MEKIYQIKNLGFAYANTQVLSDLNLTIKAGDFIAITGSNGSGKSTLLKLMIKELKHQKGSISIFNQDIESFTDWNKIGYVPQIDQAKSIAFPISVKEMVLLNLYEEFNLLNQPKKHHYKLTDDVLQMFSLKKFSDKNFNELSGGQKQRVMIAKAMVHNPQVLIFDEPTVGIDQKSKEEFFKILNHINRDHGITIILVTHEMEAANEHLSRTVKLRDKQIYE